MAADIPLALTFDDVSLVPQFSEILPKDVDLSTHLCRDIRLHIPLMSAAMDSVTESRTAITLAQEGGLGVIHRNMTPRQQAGEVERVKKFETGLIADPITISPEEKLGAAVVLMRTHNISGI